MKWFYDRKIATKVISISVLITFISVVIGIIGVSDIKSINKKGNEIYSQNITPLSPVNEIAVEFQSIRIAVRDHILAKADQVKQEETIKQLESQIAKNLEVYSKGISSAEEEKEYENLKANMEKYKEGQAKILQFSRENKDEEAMAIFSSLKPAVTEVDQSIKKIFEININQASENFKANDSKASSSILFMIGAILLGAFVSIGLGTFVARGISRPIKKLAEDAEKLAIGDVEVAIEESSKDEVGMLTKSFKKMVANIRRQAEIADQMAVGELNVNIQEQSEKDVLGISMKQMMKTITGLIEEMDNMAKQHDAGEIDAFLPEENFKGAYRIMAKGVNDMVKGHITVKKKAMGCVAEFARGNFNAELEKFPGKKAFINESIEGLRNNLKDVNKEINKLVHASAEGKLSERANAEAFQGDWAALIRGLNGLVDAILEPIQEAAAILEEMARGNLQEKVKGNYKGEHAKIKDALNSTIETLASYINEISYALTEMAHGNLTIEITNEYKGDFAGIKNSLNLIIQSLNEILNEMNGAAQQVASGASQVSSSSQALSSGSTEQASSVEELTASMEEIAAQTKLNAQNANQANDFALSAKEDAVQGNEQMKEMLKAMEEINETSSSISNIIKVIDEIAFQTNILALNAAVEAARAGQHGKGFAVVAEEVRNLAARSANAAKETTGLIEGSVKKVEDGTKIANHTAEALAKIVEGVTKAARLVGEIATASNEQATGITQVNQGIMQVSQVVQTNTATSEETAAASEELSSQAEILKEMVGKFRLKKSNSLRGNSYGELNPEMLKALENMMEQNKAQHVETQPRNEVGTSRIKINLNDWDFGKY